MFPFMSLCMLFMQYCCISWCNSIAAIWLVHVITLLWVWLHPLNYWPLPNATSQYQHSHTHLCAEWIPNYSEKGAHCRKRVPWVCSAQRSPWCCFWVVRQCDACGHQADPHWARQWKDLVQSERPRWEHHHSGLQSIRCVAALYNDHLSQVQFHQC